MTDGDRAEHRAIARAMVERQRQEFAEAGLDDSAFSVASAFVVATAGVALVAFAELRSILGQQKGMVAFQMMLRHCSEMFEATENATPKN